MYRATLSFLSRRAGGGSGDKRGYKHNMIKKMEAGDWRMRMHTDGIPEMENVGAAWHVRDGERWWVFDVAGEQLPRASFVASHIISGQHRPDFTPGILSGDQLIVINCKDVVMVGDDWYRVPIEWRNKYPSGQIRVRTSEMYNRDPCMLFWYQVLEHLRVHWSKQSHMYKAPMSKLWTYEDAIHPHANKCPRPWRWVDPNSKKDVWRDPNFKQNWRPSPALE